jgi:hypothetical protein
MEVAEPSESPRALQLAARVEKMDPPTTAQICAVAALATIELLDDERSHPGGEWYEAVAAIGSVRSSGVDAHRHGVEPKNQME